MPTVLWAPQKIGGLPPSPQEAYLTQPSLCGGFVFRFHEKSGMCVGSGKNEGTGEGGWG